MTFKQFPKYRTFPEISFGMGTFIGVVLMVVSIYIGTHYPWWVEVLLVLGCVLLSQTWLVRGLELGALSYLIIFFLFSLGLVVGDFNYWIQSGMALPDAPHFNPLDWFKIKQ